MGKNEYVILDAARMDGQIYRAKELNGVHSCLYEGDSEKFLGSAAPWLFRVDRDSEFAVWLRTELITKDFGCIFLEAESGEILYEHLRKFLIVRTEEDKELYFKYYEPAVLQAFLPTCESEQLLEFFGPVKSFLVDSGEGRSLSFSVSGGALRVQELEHTIGAYLGAETEVENNSDEKPHSSDSSAKWDFGF